MNKDFILVTGAAGFIGSSVANKLIELGHNVITIDNLSTGFKKNLNDKIIFFEGDVFDDIILQSVFKYNITGIIHIAGQSSGEVSFDNPIYDLNSNTQSTLKLLNYAKMNNCKKFIFASTMSVYGEQYIDYVDEKNVPNPISFYSVGKLASEHYMKIYSNYGINCIALRLFNVYGPGQNLENMRQGMVSIFLAQAFENNSILVKGSGERFRDMVYIDDVVDAFLKCLDLDIIGFKIYNVSTGLKTKVFDVIDSIKLLFFSEIEVTYEGSTEGDVFGIFGNNQLIMSELGWSPKTTFSNGIKKMYEWIISTKVK
jgi:UDP-glucose 4-epimerase